MIVSCPSLPEPIYIDQANSVEEQWCTAVDWAKLEFQAVAPVFLVHGLFAQSGTWVPAFTQFLTDQRIPHSADINLNPVGSIRWNARREFTATL